MSEHVEKLLAEAQARLKTQEAQVRETKKFVNTLLSYAGRPALFKDVDQGDAAVKAGAPLRGDEYVGKTQHVACRMILERRKKLDLGPATLDELLDELQEGGYRFSAKNGGIAKQGVHQMLSKNTAVFFRIPNGRWGLADWYPDAKRKARSQQEEGEAEEGGTEEPGSSATGEVQHFEVGGHPMVVINSEPPSVSPRPDPKRT